MSPYEVKVLRYVAGFLPLYTRICDKRSRTPLLETLDSWTLPNNNESREQKNLEFTISWIHRINHRGEVGGWGGGWWGAGAGGLGGGGVFLVNDDFYV